LRGATPNRLPSRVAVRRTPCISGCRVWVVGGTLSSFCLGC